MSTKFRTGNRIRFGTKEGVVTEVREGAYIGVRFDGHKHANIFYGVDQDGIEVIPEPIKAGDRVTWGGGAWNATVLAIRGTEVCVQWEEESIERFKKSNGVDVANVFTTKRLFELRHVF